MEQHHTEGKCHVACNHVFLSAKPEKKLEWVLHFMPNSEEVKELCLPPTCTQPRVRTHVAEAAEDQVEELASLEAFKAQLDKKGCSQPPYILARSPSSPLPLMT